MLLGSTGRLVEVLGTMRVRHEGIEPDADASMPLTVGDGDATLSIRPWGISTMDGVGRCASDPETGSWLGLSGQPVVEGLGLVDPTLAEAVLQRLTSVGVAALHELDGSFAIAWYDGRRRKLTLVRDRFGIEPLFYASNASGVLFGSRTKDLRATGLLSGGLDGEGFAQFLTYCYVPGDATLDEGVRRVPPGTLLEIDPHRGVERRERWYRLSFASPLTASEQEIAETFRGLLEEAVTRRLGQAPTGVMLSGGMDSSSVLTLARRHHPGCIRTFGFRCGGQSFDESQYAKALAEEMDTEHTEVVYGEDEALAAKAISSEMDVPFCDIGINVGTWILGRAAEGRVSYVLTGDGGDELWGSHPVYAAQKLLRFYDRVPVPGSLHRALSGAANLLHDSDRKRDIRVKLKRILPRPGLPMELGPFRWRAYYTPDELQRLLTPEWAARVEKQDPFRPVLEAYDGYDGPDDGLSPHLYNDYVTASGYYFSRLGLLRRFGIEARLPFYDRALVEFGARIPARLKLEGIERTKRLFRVAMEGVLPDVINHRKDKLGHSVPLKNWLRGSGSLDRWVTETLSPDRLGGRGLFRTEEVARMQEEHRRGRHNHSHRLWALVTLETWLHARELETRNRTRC
jgi:asparagine synthase (glutamine-hydrolysing)